ncbi:adenylosuccinate synthetase [Flavilitoribacter nigricans]|uniref:Adenylosuccinate synthetase n=1 Tax=Flavilitoribacter nigricans (strain ATCC 23147 / DSM 23189 / NBRC 102662 / NCIMB 1420 / SS-2) TaxID=1122177 RepID=A0A2D0N898_FLAN2|nr:adenylosuccinate synthetase [Flavilitoribacter nigricans]PHN04697.1 adenylosuccinate synthase [Flavilitoribacter nigricans DSM 23189 = NBRC 102662]
MQTNIVIGLGYGDEGKGLTTDYLCRQYARTLIVRFSGGHQAGHTVVTPEGQRHVFSSIGSGALYGAPTYWSRFCTFYPIAFRNEYAALAEQYGLRPQVYVDALAPVTTPYEVFLNRKRERINAHGSCGVGFGATLERQESPYRLFVQDLAYPFVLEKRLQAIRQYYWELTGEDPLTEAMALQLEQFKLAAAEALSCITIVREKEFIPELTGRGFDQLLFEGSQGILLDMDHGFFPHVTRCNTVSKNALQLIETYRLPRPEIYYISRAYQTRHGNGYLSNTNLPLELIENPQETNQYNEWQGHQRRSVLDIDLLHYALEADANYCGRVEKRLVLTCLDQLPGALPYTRNGAYQWTDDALEIGRILRFAADKVLLSYSECGAEIRAGAEAVPI